MMLNRKLIAHLVTVAILVLAAPMATATAAADEPYQITFPVAGDPWYYDGLGEARPGGRSHKGIDIFADKGTEVYAAASGTIARVNGSSESLAPERCCSIALVHNDGWVSIYAHLNNDTPGTDDGKGWGIAPGLAPGRYVEAGQLIGWVGDSGNAEDTPPHLHFELHDPSSVIINPFPSLRAAQGKDLGGAVNTYVETPRPPGSALRFGDSGSMVAKIQTHLLTVGKTAVGEADGSYGSMTETAVREFQAKSGLEVDGLAGTETKAALAGLVHATEGELIGFGRKGDQVANIQKVLADAGLNPGPADGVFGPGTLRAVLAFQKARELAADGLIGPKTKSALGID